MNNKQDILDSWNTIVYLLGRGGYNLTYKNDVDTIANFLHEKLETDKS